MNHEPLSRLREEMIREGLDAVLIGPSPAFRHLVGRAANLTERLIALLVTAERVFLIVPRLQAPLYADHALEMVIWDETGPEPGDPVGRLARVIQETGARRIGVNAEFWSGFVLRLIPLLPAVAIRPASAIDLIRAIKTADEIAGLEAAAEAIDRVWSAFVTAFPILSGLTENRLRDWIMAQMKAEGFSSIAWVDVGAGANGASSLHHGSDYVIRPGDPVVIDFAGLWQGWNGDIARVICAGDPGPAYRAAYATVIEAQEAAFVAIRDGAPAPAPDRAARAIIARDGYGDFFTHRVGHGIGLDVHEEPYLVEGNPLVLAPGMVMSDEPGIYRPGEWGIRVEDIVVLEDSGPRRLTRASKELLIHA